MKFSIQFHTTDFRGDHAADVCLAVECDPSETIEQLVQRVQFGKRRSAGDYITIRVIEIALPEPPHAD